MTSNPPPALAKKGIRQVVENINDDQRLQVPGHLLVVHFAPMIEQALRDASPEKQRRVLDVGRGAV